MRNYLKFITLAAIVTILSACGGGSSDSTSNYSDESSSSNTSTSGNADGSSSNTSTSGNADGSSSNTSTSGNADGNSNSNTNTTSGGSGSSGSGGTVQSVTVVPALGAFSAGATVELFDAATGNLIGTRTTTGSNGTAVINLGNQTNSFVIKVTGEATGVSYYDEGALPTPIQQPFLANHSLLAMVPTTVAPTGQVRIGVTPLTHMAAAFAGLTPSNLRVTPANVSESVPFTMAKAYARVRHALGLGSVHSSLEAYLNFLLAPTVLSANNRSAGIDLSTQGGYYGLLLAEMASAGASNTPAYNPMDFAMALANEAATLVSSNFSSAAITAFKQSAPRLVLANATTAVGSGSSASGYINTCVTITAEAGARMRSAMAGANSLTSLNTSVDQLAQTLLVQTRQQLSGTTANLTATRITGSGC